MINQRTEVRKHGNVSSAKDWIVDILENSAVPFGYVQPDGTQGRLYKYDTEAEAREAEALFHKLALLPEPHLGGETSAGERELVLHDSKPKIREFDTGATRDTIEGKLDYVKALSPIVLRRYVQYLNEHRLQPDGKMRDFDNWKKGIPQETYHSSKGRHFFASWLLTEGYKVSDNHGPVNEEDALCGELFNTMGKLHEILKAKLIVVKGEPDRTKPIDGGY